MAPQALTAACGILVGIAGTGGLLSRFVVFRPYARCLRCHEPIRDRTKARAFGLLGVDQAQWADDYALRVPGARRVLYAWHVADEGCAAERQIEEKSPLRAEPGQFIWYQGAWWEVLPSSPKMPKNQVVLLKEGEHPADGDTVIPFGPRITLPVLTAPHTVAIDYRGEPIGAETAAMEFVEKLHTADIHRRGLPKLPFFLTVAELVGAVHRRLDTAAGWVTAEIFRNIPTGEYGTVEGDNYGYSVLDHLHHADFEALIASLLDRDFYTVVQSNGGAGDHVADVIATSPTGEKVVVQAKHFTGGRRNVGASVMYEINGTAKPEHNADVAVCLTNGDYTEPAWRFGAKHGIRMIDRDALYRWTARQKPFGQVLTDAENHAAEM
ncbi:hypothetical protein P3T35_000516 [Kitasatospora sp. GP30]|nr:hypothetical protein [Kitasatospora sp. GP30]